MSKEKQTHHIFEMEQNDAGTFESNGRVHRVEEERESTEKHSDQYSQQSMDAAQHDFETDSSTLNGCRASADTDEVASFWYQGIDQYGNISVAEKLRVANQRYIEDVRKRFEESRQDMMRTMSMMANNRNL